MYFFVSYQKGLLFQKNYSNGHFEIKKNKYNNILNHRQHIKNQPSFKKKEFCFFFFNFLKIIFTKSALGYSFCIMDSTIIDVSGLNIKQENVIDDRFLFSPGVIQFSEVENEIQEIEKDERKYLKWKNTQIGLILTGSAIGIWVSYKGLNIWEKWMKEQEKKDIQEEIEMTGTYINPTATNIDSSIDPLTGKKIQIKSDEIN